MPVSEGDTVRVHYTGKLADGTEFDSSRDRDPLEFTVGQGQVIPGFETIVVGMDEGESKTEEIPSADAYGPRDDSRLIEVERERLPDDLDPEIGDPLEVQVQGQPPIQMRVAELDEEVVTLDGNHPLAGRDLTFEIEVVEIL